MKELVLLFLRLGATAFGGPAAHIALMEQEVVARRQWFTREEFLDLLGAANLLPGPSSTELAIFIGHRRAGVPGLVTAGLCFLLPATLMVGAIAWAYVRFGRLPAVAGLLYGVKPVIIAVIVQALWNLGRTAVKTWALGALALAAVCAGFLGLHPLATLFGGGGIAAGWRWVSRDRRLGPDAIFTLLAIGVLLLAGPWAITGSIARVGAHAPLGLGALFLAFLKIGALLYGSGYVLLAFLRTDLVVRYGWLTSAQLLDATAVGQVTPGPVFTTATFIGYLLAGPAGAAVATVGIFLPAFVFVGISGPLVARMRRSPLGGAFMDGVNVSALALMLVVTVQLARAAIFDWVTVSLFVLAAAALVRFRLNSAWLILGGATVGLVSSGIRAHL